MKALPILILVAVLCGPCACQTTAGNSLAPLYHGLTSLVDNAGSSVIRNLPLSEIFERYITLGKNATEFIEQYASRLSEAPRKIIETLVRLARNFIANIEPVLKTIASRYETSLKDLMTSAQNGARNLLSVFDGNGSNATRKLRSILSNPIEELGHVASRIVSEFGSQLVSITLELLKWTWQFMKTTGLPLLHDTLDRVAAMNGTPVAVRTLIQDFDAVYGLLQLLDFVK
ncbi:uncharacterized protein LOC143374077 [Andrena cerasifolii]|uniref:uncharacterized protein LOC143374077 n=1 Tax=Andrena cerasifolii TaxID=2819439 RepID=UPI0040375F9D